MHQVREQMAAERVIAKILDDGPAVRERARFRQGIRRRPRVTSAEQRRDRPVPHCIDHRFVRENGVGARRIGCEDNEKREPDGGASIEQDPPYKRL
jgi:hypothetical protein